MSQPTFYTRKNRKTIQETFIERWLANPNLPLSRPTIQEIVDKIEPGRKVYPLAKCAPGLLEAIEKVCRDEHKKLPPVLTAGGHVVQRDIDGTLLTKKSQANGQHTNGSGALPPPPPPPPGPKVDGRSGDRVYWTEDEMEALARKMFDIWCGNPELIGTIALANTAMHEVLPQNRWRPMASPKQTGAAYKTFLERVKDCIGRGLGKIAPEVKIETVTAPYDVDKVLHEASLPRLAAVLAYRQEEERQMFYLQFENPDKPAAKPAKSEEATLADEGVDVENIEALLPLVQVIGFNHLQHAELLKRFDGHPVRIAPSVSAGTPLEPHKLVQNGTLYLVDSTSATKAWGEMVIAQVPKDKREKVFGGARVYDHINDHKGKWIAKHPREFAVWKRRKLNPAAPAQ